VQVAVVAGQCIRLRCSHNDDGLWIESAIVPSSETPGIAPILTSRDPIHVNAVTKPYLLTAVPSCSCGFHSLCSPSRLAMYSSNDFVHFVDLLTNAVKAPHSDRVYLFADDPYLPLAVFAACKDALDVLLRCTIVTSFSEDSLNLQGLKRCLDDVVRSNVPPASMGSCGFANNVLPLSMFLEVAEETPSGPLSLLLFDPYFGLASSSILCPGSWSGVGVAILLRLVRDDCLIVTVARCVCRIPRWPFWILYNRCVITPFEFQVIALRFEHACFAVSPFGIVINAFPAFT
jgi:hypothetical protein